MESLNGARFLGRLSCCFCALPVESRTQYLELSVTMPEYQPASDHLQVLSRLVLSVGDVTKALRRGRPAHGRGVMASGGSPLSPAGWVGDHERRRTFTALLSIALLMSTLKRARVQF